MDNYYHEKVYFDFGFKYDCKEETYKFYPKRSRHNCCEIRFNGKKKNGEFLENEKSDVIFKINNEKEENKEE